MGPRPIDDYAADSVKILIEARAALGRSARVTVWMNARQAALDNQVPAEMLFTAEGVALVLKELKRVRKFRRHAKDVVRELRQLEGDRREAAMRAFSSLVQFDPQMAKMAIDVLQSRENAAQWLAGRLEKWDTRMPWELLADGDLDYLRDALRVKAREDN